MTNLAVVAGNRVDLGNASIDLEDRIAAAFLEGVRSETVAGLLDETEDAVIAAEAKAEQCRKRALDPALVAAEVAAARREMEDAAFKRDRLKAAVRKLDHRLRDLREQEEDQRRLAIYDKVRAERDALAEELAEVYPSVVARLTDLLSRIENNNQQVETVNRTPPRGPGPLPMAELVARGLPMLRHPSGDTPSIILQTRLPNFERSSLEPYAWPPAPPRWGT